MNCWHCNTELIWGGDHDINDVYGTPMKGIETNLSCPNKNCGAIVEVYLIFKEDDEKKES